MSSLLRPGVLTTAPTAARVVATAPVSTVTQLDAEAKALEREMRGRARGTVVYPDGNAPCPAGPRADNCLIGKAHPNDPNHCLLSGGPWVKPLLELPSGCDTPGLELVPLSIGIRAQGLLRQLLQQKPRPGAALDTQKTWFWATMRCCTLVGLSTNLAPGWFGRVPTREQYATPAAFASAEGEYGSEDSIRARWQFGSTVPANWRPPWRGMEVLAAQDAREGRDRRAVVLPAVRPTYFNASYSLGWNDGATVAGSLYSKLLEADALVDFSGGYGCNGAQCGVWGAGGGTTINEGLGPGIHQRNDTVGKQGHAFVFPSAAVAKGDAAAFNDKDRAKVQCQHLAGLDASAQMALIFEATKDEPSHFIHGWYYADVNIVGRYWGGAPAPLGAFREQRWERCWAPTAAYFIDEAARWAQWLVGVSLPDIIKRAVVAYIYDLEGKLEQLVARGVAITVTPSELRALREAVYASHLSEAGALQGVTTSVAAALNPVIGAILAIVNVLFAGLFSFFQSLNNPANSQEFKLVPQPLVLRTPKLDSVCSFSPEREGGVGALYLGFTDTTIWGGAPLRALAEGRDAPAALRESANNPHAWLPRLFRSQAPSPWKPYLVIGGVALTGAALWAFLRR